MGSVADPIQQRPLELQMIVTRRIELLASLPLDKRADLGSPRCNRRRRAAVIGTVSRQDFSAGGQRARKRVRSYALG
jgi:hypothetical protein